MTPSRRPIVRSPRKEDGVTRLPTARWHRLAVTGLITCSLSMISRDAYAQSTAGAQSLLITPGGRYDGMGRAGSAIASDGTAAWWNPAAVTNVRSPRLFGTEPLTVLVPGLAHDVTFGFWAATVPLRGVAISLQTTDLSYGLSTAISDEEEELGEFESYERALGATLALTPLELAPRSVRESIPYVPGDVLSVGVTVKEVTVDLAPAWATPDGEAGKGDAWVWDYGLIVRTPVWRPLGGPPALTSPALRVSAGMAWTNRTFLGNGKESITFIDEGQASPLGRIRRDGVAVEIVAGPLAWTAAFDSNQPQIILAEDGSYRERFIRNWGNEVSAEGIVFGRFGYVHDRDGDILDHTYGMGIVVPLPLAVDLRFDYARVPQARALESSVNKFGLEIVASGDRPRPRHLSTPSFSVAYARVTPLRGLSVGISHGNGIRVGSRFPIDGSPASAETSLMRAALSGRYSALVDTEPEEDRDPHYTLTQFSAGLRADVDLPSSGNEAFVRAGGAGHRVALEGDLIARESTQAGFYAGAGVRLPTRGDAAIEVAGTYHFHHAGTAPHGERWVELSIGYAFAPRRR